MIAQIIHHIILNLGFIQHLNLEERSSTPANPVTGSGKKIFHAHLQNTDG